MGAVAAFVWVAYAVFVVIVFAVALKAALRRPARSTLEQECSTGWWSVNDWNGIVGSPQAETGAFRKRGLRKPLSTLEREAVNQLDWDGTDASSRGDRQVAEPPSLLAAREWARQRARAASPSALEHRVRPPRVVPEGFHRDEVRESGRRRRLTRSLRRVLAGLGSWLVSAGKWLRDAAAGTSRIKES